MSGAFHRGTVELTNTTTLGYPEKVQEEEGEVTLLMPVILLPKLYITIAKLHIDKYIYTALEHTGIIRHETHYLILSEYCIRMVLFTIGAHQESTGRRHYGLRLFYHK